MKAQPQRIYISLGIFFVTGVARELCTMQSGRGASVGVRCTVQESGHLGVDNGTAVDDSRSSKDSSRPHYSKTLTVRIF